MSHYGLDYGVSLNGTETLPPITLAVTGGAWRVQDYLTPEQAADLGARLSAMALKCDQAERGRDSFLEVVDPPDRHLTVANEPARSGHEPDSPNDWPEP